MVGWKKMIARGSNATTPLSAEKHRVVVDHYGECYSAIYDFGTPSFMIVSGPAEICFPTQPELMTDISNADRQAASGFYKKLRSRRSQFQGGVFLGEIQEAIHLLKNPVRALFDDLPRFLKTLQKRRKGLRRLKYVDATRAKLSSILSETWLEYSFGWKPFIQDISDITSSLDRIIDHSSREMISSSGVDRQVGFMYTGNANAFGNVMFRYSIIEQRKVSVKYSGLLREVPYGVSNSRVIKDLGLSIQDFVPTLWEILPWSFLADYFVNIGDVLACTFTDTSDVLWTTRTVRYETVSTWHADLDHKRFKDNYPNKKSAIWGTLPQVRRIRTVVNRQPTLGLPPIPSLTLKVPGRPQQWLNMVSLAATRKIVEPFI